MDMEQRLPKIRDVKFRRREFTQAKEYNKVQIAADFEMRLGFGNVAIVYCRNSESRTVTWRHICSAQVWYVTLKVVWKQQCDILESGIQWRTQEFCSGRGVGSKNSVEDRENRDLGVIAP